jgi:uncharacterized protein (TIGR00369 family)
MSDGIRYGVIDPAEAAGLTGIEMLQAMIAGDLPAPPIAERLGFRLTEVADGTAVFVGEAGPHLLNPLGSVHGGWALTLIDSAGGCAVHTTLPAGVGYTTVETKANFTRAIRADGGLYRCEGRVLSAGRQIATADVRLFAPDGNLAAHGTSTLMILRRR